MKDTMLDLETMGNGPNAAIIAIGAVEFDLDTCEIGAVFHCRVQLDSAVKAGGVIDASTVQWWLDQNDEARKPFTTNVGSLSIALALCDFSAWVRRNGVERVWGNGAAFDNVILRSAYHSIGMSEPWNHWNDRCYRTIKAFFPDIKLERIGVHHNALDDALSQAEHLIRMIGKQDSSGQSI